MVGTNNIITYDTNTTKIIIFLKPYSTKKCMLQHTKLYSMIDSLLVVFKEFLKCK